MKRSIVTSKRTMSDQHLVCRLCGEGFVFSAGEQELQRLRGLERAPTRCPVCRRRPPTLPWIPKLGA
jgi:Probable zinc-ribbon domain